MSKQIIKSAGTYMATLGLYATAPYKSYSSMVGFVINKSTKSVVLYKVVKWPDKDPTDKYTLKAQRDRLLRKCFPI